MSETRKLFESFQHNLNEAIKSTVEYVTPIYTDGGIYVYIGKLNDENYFIAEDSIFNKNMPSFSIRMVNKNPEEDEDDFWNTEWQEEHLVRDMTDGETETKELTKQILDWIIENHPDGNYDLGDMEDRRKILNSTKEMKESEDSELDKWWNTNYKKAIDYVEKAGPEYIADLIYDGNTDMYYEQTAKHVALDLLHILGIKEFEKEINYINSLDESEEPSKSLIKTCTVTDYGYHNNEDTMYGELTDGNWFVFIPFSEDLMIYNSPITDKYIDCLYNYHDGDPRGDDAWFDQFEKEHKINNYNNEDSLIRELNKRYFNLKDEEE